MDNVETLKRRIHNMNVQLTTLDLYTNGLQQMLPVLLDAYSKAKANNLLENDLNAMQEEILPELPGNLHEVILSIREMAQ
jgi:hypothetical protein